MNNKIALLAAAVAASTASVSAQAATYQYSGNITDCNIVGGFIDACGQLTVAVGDSMTVAFETNVVGSVDTADIFGSGTYVPDRGPNANQVVDRDEEDGARFFIADGITGNWKLPMIYNGTSNVGGNEVRDTTGLTVDGTYVTDGTLTFTSAAGTGQQATLVVDYDTSTWVAWQEAGIGNTGDPSNIAVGEGKFNYSVTKCNGIPLKTGE